MLSPFLGTAPPELVWEAAVEPGAWPGHPESLSGPFSLRQGWSFGDQAETHQHLGSCPSFHMAFSCTTSIQLTPGHPIPPGSGTDHSPFLPLSPSEVSFL